jgi:hypothetical protein
LTQKTSLDLFCGAEELGIFWWLNRTDIYFLISCYCNDAQIQSNLDTSGSLMNPDIAGGYWRATQGHITVKQPFWFEG